MELRQQYDSCVKFILQQLTCDMLVFKPLSNMEFRIAVSTPFHFFLWGYFKSQVYANKPDTIQQLKDEITPYWLN